MNQNDVSAENTTDEPKDKFLENIKKSKKKIMIGGIFISGVAICGMIIYKKYNSINVFTDGKVMKNIMSVGASQSLQTTSEPTIIGEGVTNKTISVKGHKRKLPEGYHASPKKIEFADSHGIMLEPNQTYIDPYQKGVS